MIAPSFGDIFRQNSLKIGLLPVTLSAAAVKELMVTAHEGELTVDLEAQTVTAAGAVHSFEIDSFPRRCLLEGLDEIALTLQNDDAIAAYEAAHPAQSRRSPPCDERGGRRAACCVQHNPLE